MISSRSLLWVVASAVVVAAACSEDNRAILDNHVGPLGFGINMAKASTNIAPGFIRIPPSPLATATPATDSVRIRVGGIDSLTTGTYTVWFANDSATKWALVTSGNLVVTRTDSTYNAVGDIVITSATTTRTGISGWRAGGSNKSFVFHTNRAAANMAATDSLNVVVVSIETGTPGTAPSENRVLWGRRSERLQTFNTANPPVLTAQGDSTPIRFGTFRPRLSEQLLYTQNSSMAITPRGRVEVRGPIFVMNDSNYLRPPVGYYYAAFVMKVDSLNRIADTVYLGRRTTPYPAYVSLYAADKSNPDPLNVFDSPPVIYAMGLRVSADTVAEAKSGTDVYWRDFTVVNVTLESRFATEGRMGPAVVMTTTLPGSVSGH